MKTYRVRLLRTISDDTGHEHQIVQAEFEIVAADESKAVQMVEPVTLAA